MGCKTQATKIFRPTANEEKIIATYLPRMDKQPPKRRPRPVQHTGQERPLDRRLEFHRRPSRWYTGSGMTLERKTKIQAKEMEASTNCDRKELGSLSLWIDVPFSQKRDMLGGKSNAFWFIFFPSHPVILAERSYMHKVSYKLKLTKDEQLHFRLYGVNL